MGHTKQKDEEKEDQTGQYQQPDKDPFLGPNLQVNLNVKRQNSNVKIESGH